MSEKIDFPSVIKKFDKILERGLCSGIGVPDGQMCIEAAIAQAMDLPFNDKPKCVEPAIRTYKITLNDKGWSRCEKEGTVESAKSDAVADAASTANDKYLILSASLALGALKELGSPGCAFL